ncbi:hypothetical protein VNI00_000023 [Paramarasmius palmivorus]|uniref:F-box domain-containing protein n=1 Tax=Paramarasmius palmivorus TaxID=297713 RepID=A0AAW0EEX2_9AGAR
MGIQTLPDDIYIAIFQYLPLAGVLNLRQVCSTFSELTRSRALWVALLHREVQVRGLPMPRLRGAGVDSLSAAEIESCLRHALKLHRTWNSTSPPATRRRSFSVTDATSSQAARIVSLHFMVVEGRYLLLSACMKQHVNPRTVLLELWDIDQDMPFCVARRQIGWSGGFAVNTIPTTRDGILAIKSPHVEVWTVDLSGSQPDDAFVTLSTLSCQAKSVLSFTGSTLLLRGSDDEIKVVDATRPLFEVELRHPQPVLPANQPYNFEAIIGEDYVILLRTTTLELYSLSSFRKGDDDQQVLSPSFVHTFPWRIDSSRIERDMKCLDASQNRHNAIAPINVLLRFSSLFPWPVNLLQHYVLHPEPTYSPSSDVSPANIPYQFPAILQQTIASPVRLFAFADTALGPYGTAIWLDSHTEDYFMQGEIGQRLAGLMLSPVSLSSEDSESDSGIQPVMSDNIEHSKAAMVFDVQEKEDWCRIAMDEVEGRVAVGSITGNITLYDYA